MDHYAARTDDIVGGSPAGARVLVRRLNSRPCFGLRDQGGEPRFAAQRLQVFIACHIGDILRPEIGGLAEVFEGSIAISRDGCAAGEAIPSRSQHPFVGGALRASAGLPEKDFPPWRIAFRDSALCPMPPLRSACPDLRDRERGGRTVSTSTRSFSASEYRFSLASVSAT